MKMITDDKLRELLHRACTFGWNNGVVAQRNKLLDGQPDQFIPTMPTEIVITQEDLFDLLIDEASIPSAPGEQR